MHRSLSYVALAALAGCTGSVRHETTPNLPPDEVPSAPPAPAVEPRLPDPGPPDLDPPAPFEATAPESYVAKVKNLLTGLPPSDADLTAVRSNPAALAGLVDGWLQTPQADSKLLAFFATAFQQNQFLVADLQDQLTSPGPGGAAFNTQVMANLQQSFARTALALVREGRPFTETVTTDRFQLTPALGSLLAFIDARQADDAGRVTDLLYVRDKTWTFSVQGDPAPIPLTETLDPTSPRFLTWSAGAAFAAPCARPLRTFGPGAATSVKLFGTLYGNVGADPMDTTQCNAVNAAPQLVDADFASWRWVRVRPPAASEQPSTFYDLARIRAADELVLTTPRVGFFTTPAFLATWATNTSNQARVTMNQTLIVALGRSFDPSNTAVPVSESGLDVEHADPTSACYSCHRTLDPMRNFFRKNLTLSFHAQKDAKQTALQPQFAVDGVSETGNTLADLARQLATHPRFAAAWTQKLCYFADSAACSEDDPEFVRVAQAFAASQFDFRVLVRELFTSPLVTGAAHTKTFDDRGVVVSISRLSHFCSALSSRLGLPSACTLSAKAKSVSSNLPSDAFSRGADIPLVNVDPSLFYQAATENLCRFIAEGIVDAGPKRYVSANPQAAIDDLLANVMGLAPSDPRALPARKILADHFAAARAVPTSATDALRSTFTLACTSPSSVGVGL